MQAGRQAGKGREGHTWAGAKNQQGKARQPTQARKGQGGKQGKCPTHGKVWGVCVVFCRQPMARQGKGKASVGRKGNKAKGKGTRGHRQRHKATKRCQGRKGEKECKPCLQAGKGKCKGKQGKVRQAGKGTVQWVGKGKGVVRQGDREESQMA